MGQHAVEAEQRWGHTEAWRQSAQRAAGYTSADWNALRAEAAANVATFADAMHAAQAPDSAPAMAAAEEHREHIARWFYDLDHDMHRNLGDLYVADPRFTERYDGVAPGMAAYVRAAIHANADSRS